MTAMAWRTHERGLALVPQAWGPGIDNGTTVWGTPEVRFPCPVHGKDKPDSDGLRFCVKRSFVGLVGKQQVAGLHGGSLFNEPPGDDAGFYGLPLPGHDYGCCHVMEWFRFTGCRIYPENRILV